MSEEKIISLLKEAYICFTRIEKGKYYYYLEMAGKAIEEYPEQTNLKGEYLIVLSFSYMLDTDKFLASIREACKYIKGYSRVLPRRAAIFGDYYNVFGICNIKPGEAEAKADKVTELTGYFGRLTGGGQGADVCYRAQLAFYRGEMGQARMLAANAFELAEQNGQMLVALCACDLLADIAKHEMDDKLWKFACGYMRRIAEEEEGALVSETARLHAQGLFYMQEMSVGCIQNIPEWFVQDGINAIPVEEGYQMVGEGMSGAVVPTIITTRIEYYCYSGKFAQALLQMEIAQKVYGIRTVLTDAFYGFFQAICYFHLGEKERMKKSVEIALEKIRPDGLWLIAAIFEEVFGDLIYEIEAGYDINAAENIRRLGQDFQAKLKPLREIALQTPKVHMTRRERDVVELLLKGMSNNEIANRLNIKERTVRSHLEHVYGKYHVKRRMELAEVLKYSGESSTAVWIK